MLTEAQDLAAIQIWTQAAIMDERPLEALLLELDASLEDVLLPTQGQSAARSLEVYRSMGRARFEAALRSDHAVLAAVLGPQSFAELARAYMARHPSSGWTLDGIDARLPGFLAGWDGLGAPVRAALADLALLECAVAEARRRPGTAPMDGELLASLPPGGLEHATLQAAPSLRLLELGHDALAAIEGHERDGRAGVPILRRTCVIVLRREAAVRAFREAPRTFGLLDRLVHGEPVAAALSGCPGLTAKAAQAAFTRWASAGVFVGVRAVVPARGRAAG